MSQKHSPEPASTPTADAYGFDTEYDAPETAVVAAVAAVEGVDMTAVEPNLHDAIDGDVLTLLADHRGTSWRLAFDLGDHAVVVSGDGTVVVDDTTFDDAFVA
ncbi:HalOD1 output domain-containing protein [Halobaculum lipolyticum]|uniref:HalOD1 output domain-containing protein n=1 Tax=Halobaculum lipolyticum TaxID=3032001 RepID=A0ABD5WG80_9EURY|nr:HalOD1 output domain-containing protein [Halobaculum sp. DT31]